MKVRFEFVSFYLLCGVILLAIGWGDAFTCPEHCQCVEVGRKRYNHAKCTSLDGLRILGKTSDLHSLDLSSLNLTKINNQLDKLTNLSKVDLSDNQLSEINALHTKRIRTLNLSGNRITSGKLDKIPSTVKNLKLNHNDITVLTENFKRFVHLQSLELADNPLNCTCDTLEIRNWLQERAVYTENPIRCMAPIQFKGWSWLRASQSIVCDPNGLETPRMLPFSADATEDNDLMMGDDPNAGRSEELSENEEGFLPVSANNKRTETDTDDYINDDVYDGSGSSTDDSPLKDSDAIVPEQYEGSGDEDDEAVTMPAEPKIEPIDIDGDDHISNETQSDEIDDVDDDKELLTALVPPLNVSSIETNDAKENATIEVAPQEADDGNSTVPIVEQAIMQEKTVANEAEYVQSDDVKVTGETGRSESTKMDNSQSIHESKSTFILLAVLGILLVVLILYVAIKRSKTTTKNRRNNNDIESPAQEMLTMDKNNLGKPIQNPVEFIPLIPEKHDGDKKANVCNGEEPLLQKLTEIEQDNQPNENGVDGKTPQQLNGNAKPIQNGVNGVHPSDNITSNEHPTDGDRQFQSISPKPSRYSPVYSHDTGRVKIKLSETSRPKTPILVTRSRSNAGDNKFDKTVN